MITRNDIVRMLVMAAGGDQRTVGDEDVRFWLQVAQVERWHPAAAARVVFLHYCRGADKPRLTPAQVSDRLRTLRNQAAESFELPRIPAGLPDAEYPAWLRRQLAAHCDAQLERWASTGEEPSRALPLAGGVADLTELVTRAPLQHRKAIGSGVRTMRDRKVRLDPARRAEAHAELDAARHTGDAS